MYDSLIMEIKIKLENRMLCRVESGGETEKGKYKRYILRVRMTSGTIGLQYWDSRRGDFPSPGDFLELRVRDLALAQAELDRWGTVSLDTLGSKPYYCDIVPVNEEDIPEDVLRKLIRDRNPQRQKVLEMLGNSSYWKRSGLHDFLIGFFKNEAERFATVPAALEHHHNYKGGLLIHTGDVFSRCVGMSLAPMADFDLVDTDVLYMAAWFHDVGKMDVYWMEGDNPRMNSDKESMTGHITLSDRMFRRAAESFGLDSDFVEAVSHCILSHHDRLEWGSVVVPQTIEAKILCRMDYISSRMPD